MKFPFLNRKRYIEIHAYTNSKRALQDVPITLTKNACTKHLNAEKLSIDAKKYRNTFETCYGKLASLRTSLTLPTWCEFEVKSNDRGYDINYPDNNRFFQVSNVEDPYFRPKDIYVAKIEPPWKIECKTNTTFVFASHILNTTPLQIGTGVVYPKADPTLNFFVYIPKNTHYVIPYRMPVVQMFPISDLPLHVESHYDEFKYNELFSMGFSKPYFISATQKIFRHETKSV